MHRILLALVLSCYFTAAVADENSGLVLPSVEELCLLKGPRAIVSFAPNQEGNLDLYFPANFEIGCDNSACYRIFPPQGMEDRLCLGKTEEVSHSAYLDLRSFGRKIVVMELSDDEAELLVQFLRAIRGS